MSTKTLARPSDPILVLPGMELPVDTAILLPPLAEAAIPEGSVRLPHGVLREIRVDRAALAYNTAGPQYECRCDICRPLNEEQYWTWKLKPTWVVRSNGSEMGRYFALEIRGSVMCLNGKELERYGCAGTVSSETAYVATMAEIVAYTRPPDAQ